MRAQVFVRLKPGVLDVQGKAIERGLAENDFSAITNIRVGKLIEFDVAATNADKAHQIVESVCQKLLANTIIENYEIKLG
ncbi:MAG: phosphoribosylformylglycinamidine synthase subunit PurS [Oligoflexia bacterium]|nr:phosphoribosylformylglycinamidine synthase subunit PurS [Oligoflexia bacterium]